MADLLNGTGEYGFSESVGTYTKEIDNFKIEEAFGGNGWFSTNLVGINLSTVQAIETSVKKTITELKQTVQDFGGDGKEVFEVAIKGKVVEAAWTYTKEIKELINRYITNLQGLVDLCGDAAKALKEADTSNKTDIESSSTEIKSIMSDVQERENSILTDLMSGYGGGGN